LIFDKWQLLKKTTKIGIWLQPIGLGGLDQAKEGGAGIRTAGGACKEPIPPTEDELRCLCKSHISKDSQMASTLFHYSGAKLDNKSHIS